MDSERNRLRVKARAERRLAWQQYGLPAMASAALLWAAFPPLGLSLLVWLAPIGLLSIIDREASPGRRGYFQIWLAGSLFWLANLQGIRLAFWPLYFGWIALALYLAVYFPLMVGLARTFHHAWKWPLAVAAPVAWVGLELCRAYLLTGFAASTLAHAHYRQPLVIQLADQVGVYGVSWIIMCGAVAIYRLVQASRRRTAPGPTFDLVLPAAMLVILLGYGAWRLPEGDRLSVVTENRPALLRIALLQENTPSMFDADLERLEKAWTRYQQLTGRVMQETGPVDLIVWPESTFGAAVPWLVDKTTVSVPPEMAALNYDRTAVAQRTEELQREFAFKVRVLHDTIRAGLARHSTAAASTGAETGSSTTGSLITNSAADAASSQVLPHLLVGNDAMVIDDRRVARYNSALLIDPEGQVSERYDKIHLVMFGEYIPLNWLLGFLGEAFGMGSATPGESPVVFEVNRVQLMPSICFESVLPQFIAWQMRTMVAAGHVPDVLISITNDSWFRGSAILDHHLACEVMSAIEMRRPFVVAANTGLTAWIAGSGRIVECSPRLDAAYIIADVCRDNRWGLTQAWGDLPGWVMAVPCLLAVLANMNRLTRFRRRGMRT